MKKCILLFLFLLLPLVIATNNTQNHNASQIYPESFTWGNYTFPANLTVNDTLIGKTFIITENLTITDTIFSKDINLTGNITLADKIIFRLGEYIYNLFENKK